MRPTFIPCFLGKTGLNDWCKKKSHDLINVVKKKTTLHRCHLGHLWDVYTVQMATTRQHHTLNFIHKKKKKIVQKSVSQAVSVRQLLALLTAS